MLTLKQFSPEVEHMEQLCMLHHWGSIMPWQTVPELADSCVVIAYDWWIDEAYARQVLGPLPRHDIANDYIHVSVPKCQSFT